MRGDTPLTAVASGPNSDQFSIALGTLTNTTATKEDAATVRCDALTADTGTIAITVNIAGAFTATKVFTLTKAKAGAAGVAGLNNGLVFIYKRAASAPALPSATTTYTFASGVLTGLDNGWTQAVPAANGNPLYVSAATASSAGATDTIAAAEWAGAIVLAQDGVGGAAGLNNASIFIYKRAASAPALPSATTTYTFASGVLTGLNNGWAQAVPAANGNPLYVSTATAISTSGTDTITAAEWAGATILAQDGAPGNNGERGSKHFYGAIAGYSWDDSAADATISAAGLSKVLLDQVTLYNTTAGYAETRFWSGSTWATIAQVIDGNLLVNGTVGAQKIATGDLVAMNLAQPGHWYHPSYPSRKFRASEFSSSYATSQSWAAASAWGFTPAPAAVLCGPGHPDEAINPICCCDASGYITILIHAQILGYTGNVTLYYRRNGGSYVPIWASNSDDGGNVRIADVRQFGGFALTDKIEFYVAPCDGSGNIPTAVSNKWFNLEVLSLNV
jgi:hypothetical protein